MSQLDPRLHAYRADLAAESLRGQVSAPRYAPGRPAQVVCGVADVRRRPAVSALLDTQLLCGETVTVYDEADGWAWVQNATDDYVGYVESGALGSGDSDAYSQRRRAAHIPLPRAEHKGPAPRLLEHEQPRGRGRHQGPL